MFNQCRVTPSVFGVLVGAGGILPSALRAGGALVQGVGAGQGGGGARGGHAPLHAPVGIAAEGVVTAHEPLHLVHAGVVVLMDPPEGTPGGQLRGGRGEA